MTNTQAHDFNHFAWKIIIDFAIRCAASAERLGDPTELDRSQIRMAGIPGCKANEWWSVRRILDTAGIAY